MAAPDRTIESQLARKHSQIKTMAEGAEIAKAAVRAFVEHPYHILKNNFRHREVWYRGLAKNGHQLYTHFGLSNVVMGG